MVILEETRSPIQDQQNEVRVPSAAAASPTPAGMGFAFTVRIATDIFGTP